MRERCRVNTTSALSFLFHCPLLLLFLLLSSSSSSSSSLTPPLSLRREGELNCAVQCVFTFWKATFEFKSATMLRHLALNSQTRFRNFKCELASSNRVAHGLLGKKRIHSLVPMCDSVSVLYFEMDRS